MASTFRRICVIKKTITKQQASSFRFCSFRNTPFIITAVRSLCCRPTAVDNRVNFITNSCDIEELQNVQGLVHNNLFVYDDFITPHEEDMLYEEMKTSLEKQNYQFEHWDNVIHGYRESEKTLWSRDCMMIFKRMKDIAFDPKKNTLLPYVHILDLDSKGFIKPHIDSIKFCGSTIAGLSLLSSSIMRFRHENFKGVMVDAMLSPRSLYICRNAIRYQFTHEILPPELSVWKENVIERTRRISVMLRCEPEPAGT